jgi:glycosyltransferase involved in cell wall biosynthesis
MGQFCVTTEQSSKVVGQLFFISRVWKSRHGGSLYGRQLVNELLRRGWRVTLLAERFDDDTKSRGSQRYEPHAERVWLEAFFRRGFLNWRRRISETLTLWKRIAHTPGALVIVQGDLPRVLYLLLQLRVPLIFIRQDAILTCPGNNRFLRRSRAVCRRPFGVACLGTHRKEGCLEGLSLPRQVGRLAFRARDSLLLRQIRHFVVNSNCMVAAHRRPGFVLYPPRLVCQENGGAAARDLHRLVFCGRLEEAKGAADAVRILSLLPVQFYLEILGDGAECERLARMVQEYHLGNRVKFRGWVDSLTRDRILVSAGVLLMPSLWAEAYGMVGMEALAQGTPVVAYDVGGVSEWCRGQAGILVRCGDVGRAAMAVRGLTEDPIRWAIHSSAAKRVAELEFPTDRFGRELDQLLREVLKPR